MFLNIINYIYKGQTIKIAQEKGRKKHTEKNTEKPQLNV